MSPSFPGTTVLFGGSFDPPHRGHLALAEGALARLPDARLYFVPAHQSPGKPAPMATGAQRKAWLELLCQDQSQWQVWDWELKKGGTSYTVETLEEAHRRGARREDLYWLVGADAYAARQSWKEGGRLGELCRFLVAARPGAEFHLIRDDLALPCPLLPVSSSALRKSLKEGAPPRNLPDLPLVLQEEFHFWHPYASTERP